MNPRYVKEKTYTEDNTTNTKQKSKQMIIRGTTPTIAFNVKTELDLDNIAEVWITFRSKSNSPSCDKTYTKKDVVINKETHEILLSLSQEDTLNFSGSQMQVQLRLRMYNGSAYASGIMETIIGDVLKEGVI